MTDFTECEYRSLIQLARPKWGFVSFPEHDLFDRCVLWRHDIDISPNRALALAKIEREEKVSSTFFILLHSDFYNALETETAGVLRSIAAYGHHIGLHFDPTFYGDRIASRDDLENFLRLERGILQDVLGLSVSTFSWHNPTIGDWGSIEDDTIAGMTSAYGKSIKDRYRYASDSNGVWRHDRIADVLKDNSNDRLHILTHPEWWVPSSSLPRDRVVRAVEGRATSTMKRYDDLLKRCGRPNEGNRSDL